MSIAKRNGTPYNAFAGFFDDLLSRDVFDWNTSNFSNTGTTLPAVNIKETADNYEVQMAAPGMSKEDFKIELDNHILTISSEKRQESEESEGVAFNRREFSYQSFQRSFRLAKEAVDAEQIQAKYHNGVLHLLIPKKEEVKQKPSRLINIS